MVVLYVAPHVTETDSIAGVHTHCPFQNKCQLCVSGRSCVGCLSHMHGYSIMNVMSERGSCVQVIQQLALHSAWLGEVQAQAMGWGEHVSLITDVILSTMQEWSMISAQAYSTNQKVQFCLWGKYCIFPMSKMLWSVVFLPKTNLKR